MKKAFFLAGAAVALALGGNAATPDVAAARKAGAVCQYYKGDPLCKTESNSYCIGGDVGVEGRVCRETTDYWYWS